nr:hypothetical protein [Methylobacterium sp. GC_Met_2]
MTQRFYGKFSVQSVFENEVTSVQCGGETGGRHAWRLPTAAKIALAAACTLGLAACVTPQERHAMDQNQCFGFGFEPGTDAFAECMMGLHQDRAAAEAATNRYWQAQRAEQSRRREAQRDLYKAMSLQRTGDTRFPVCGASYDGGMDHRTMTWYGPNCRAR